ncbi:dihydrodipicolinate synthase family protein [Pedobacter heparinus]|uniref:Dihydrodipicolinate synthetase n=1 Tax=Pedobacter heparinus (strain ATCC 13125 / DSM 2366 / CIP 104194 / JCM 7457 / NBRC 12017 / NCIMB 9290 / NRRL B-14731 / HIM 762-3) TaxID=485917 RepID=C6XY10_PEDHD|nr:dihydrodipicolinate synthase family protein [Pedobacter heparinus]ACU04428.1 dihydrodipicolinate synthetase [Pedobacter heparinus DSM 2366]
MTPLKATEIYGNWATLLLPLNIDDSINYSQLEEEIDTLIAFKVDGIYSNGTAGEFYNQTEEEFDLINALLAKKCNAAGMPFQIGASHMSPEISLQRVQRARSLKPSAIQVILPDWFVPTIEEIIVFLKVMAKAADPIGLILYNPPHAKKKLSPADFLDILQAGVPLAGCKVAGGDVQWYQDMQELPVPFSVFIPGHHLATGISRGAHGAYSNVACLNPAFAQKWYNDIHIGDKTAFELETRIQRFMNECIVPYITDQGYANQAVDKFMAAVGGWTPISPRLRWPYRWIPEEDVPAIRKKCKEILPEVFN